MDHGSSWGHRRPKIVSTAVPVATRKTRYEARFLPRAHEIPLRCHKVLLITALIKAVPQSLTIVVVLTTSKRDTTTGWHNDQRLIRSQGLHDLGGRPFPLVPADDTRDQWTNRWYRVVRKRARERSTWFRYVSVSVIVIVIDNVLNTDTRCR